MRKDEGPDPAVDGCQTGFGKIGRPDGGPEREQV
jgi:hypothetical protein